MGSNSRKGVTPLLDFARQRASIKNSYIRSALAEFLGTYILLLFAVGAGCQGAILAEKYGAFGTWFMSLLGGVIGLMISIIVVGGASGAHVNPAFTLAAAIHGSLSWFKLPVYWFAQFFGAYLGSGTAYGLYTQLLKDSTPCKQDLTQCGSLAFVFAPPPQDHLGIAFLDQTIGTALLVILILAACDPRNMKVPSHCYGPLFAVTVAGINCAFGLQAGGVLNPARDIGARLMAITVGFKGQHVFLHAPGTNNEEHYWVAPMFGPLCGGILAALIYTFVIAAHLKDESPPEDVEAYVPNRFNIRIQPKEQRDYQPQPSSYAQTAQSSLKSYAPQPLSPPAEHYRNGNGY